MRSAEAAVARRDCV